MYSVITLLVVFVGSLYAERNIIPSPAVCATFPNEEFVVDVGRCQNTCEFYGRNYDCPNYYKPLGDCYCKSGFARLAEDGKCVSVTKNAVCVGKLPIARASCKPNEEFSTNVKMGVCDVSCSTYGCRRTYDSFDFTDPPGYVYKWAPHCQCTEFYRRASNGNCVHVSDPQCVAEYQPSTARCEAIGQIYKNNAPCQPACYGETYCPPAGPACICPPGTVSDPFEMSYYTVEYIWNEEYQYGYNNYTTHTTLTASSCIYADQCPPTTPGPN